MDTRSNWRYTLTKLLRNIEICFLFFMLVNCTAPKSVSEAKYIKINESEAGLSFKKLKNQEQLINKQGATRGILDAYLISLATNGIKNMIDKRKSRYTAGHSMSLTDLHFYNNLSTNGIFDPNGIIFQGFSLVRLVNEDNSNAKDTAFVAHFILDTANSYEIANSSMFRLKLDSLDYRFPKAKYKHGTRTMNIDFEITFSCSYVNEAGSFFSNVVLGKFYYSVRNAPLDKSDTQYTGFYHNLRNTPLTGASFIVPRSYGYYISEGNELKPSYSWGNYSIAATVTESSKEAFIDKVIYDNSGLIMEASKTGMENISNKVTQK